MNKVKQQASSYAKYEATGEVGNLLEYTKDGVKIPITPKEAKAIQNTYKVVVSRTLSQLNSMALAIVKEDKLPFELAKKVAKIKIRSSALTSAKNKILKIND